MEEMIGLAGVPLVVALVEAMKRAWPELEPRWYPLVALFWGVALNLALALMLGYELGPALLLGVVAGLAASGLYSGSKAVVEGSSNTSR